MLELNKIYCMDCIAGLKEVQPRTVDLTVTSPPYNVNIGYDKHDDKMPYSEYLEFTKNWLSACHTVSRGDGRLCLNIPLEETWKNVVKNYYVDVMNVAGQVGWKFKSTILWIKGVSNTSGTWMSARSPVITPPAEVIAVMYKENWQKQYNGKSDITKPEFARWIRGIWTFGGQKKSEFDHPAPFPLELPKRCIKLFTYVGDTVLDPFNGSGTTTAAAKRLGRNFIGFDISEKYCETANRRLDDAHDLNEKTVSDAF